MAAVGEISEDILGEGEGAVVTKKKVKIIDKKGALDSIGKHLKLFTDKVEHSGTVDIKSMSDEELKRIIEGGD